jgi:uncharacterized protein
MRHSKILAAWGAMLLGAQVVHAEPLAVHSVQGAAHESPLLGQSVEVGPAIVTALRSNGFYMQSAAPDADAATSEGIFVFTSRAPAVSVGDRVTVRGAVGEFRPGCTPSCSVNDSAYDNLTITQLASPEISVLGSGNALPAPVLLAPPLQSIVDGIAYYESLEGMRVQLDGPSVVDPTRSLSGSSREIGVVAGPAAGLRTPRGGVLLREDDANPERIFLSNAIVSSFPTLNVGDAFDGAVVGVLDYTFANYKLLVTEPLPGVIGGALQQEVSELAASAPTQLSIASMNVENLDPLDPEAKFAELARIVVDHLRAPDLIALEEVQDNDGPADNGVVDASETLGRFIAAIASAGGPGYAFRQIDPLDKTDGGEPGGNIRLAFLYRTDRGLGFVARGNASSTSPTAVDTSLDTPQLTLSPGRIAPLDPAFAASRKPLAGELTFLGRTLFVIANHFNSKGGDDPLFGRTQPPLLSSELQRSQQAARVADFAAQILAADSGALVVALGDFNDFSYSPPLQTLQAAGLVDLIDTLPENERYSYVYQGNSQALDHILVSESLASHARYDVVHVNAEFAEQASDHDPAVVLIDFDMACGS